MTINGPNHPLAFWGVCYLWLASMAMIIWSMMLFVCVSDMVGALQLHFAVALSMLSGLTMAPANAYMLYALSKGERLDPYVVVCCPLWLSIISAIIVNVLGVGLCAYKIHASSLTINKMLTQGMQLYRSSPKHKHIMDTIQWAIKCCGLDSYTDWFSQDWYDKIRDYEWDPDYKQSKRETLVTDSVPLSCCKTGSCVSNYLMEMGTSSINSMGCAQKTLRVVRAGLIVQTILFASLVVVEVLILCCIWITKRIGESGSCPEYDVQQLLTANSKFESSCSLESISSSGTDDTNSRKVAECKDE